MHGIWVGRGTVRENLGEIRKRKIERGEFFNDLWRAEIKPRFIAQRTRDGTEVLGLLGMTSSVKLRDWDYAPLPESATLWFATGKTYRGPGRERTGKFSSGPQRRRDHRETWKFEGLRL